MATIYYTEEDPKNPTFVVGGFFKSGITLNSANRQVKKLNKDLTFDEKSINRQYAVIERNFTKEEFELMLLKELQDE